jgi:hypothetical protein
MSETKEPSRRPDPERLEVLKRLPAEITGSFSKEEMHAFLFEKDWPDSLREKLRDYLVEDA